METAPRKVLLRTGTIEAECGNPDRHADMRRCYGMDRAGRIFDRSNDRKKTWRFIAESACAS